MAASRGSSLVAAPRLLIAVASPLWSASSGAHGLLWLRGMGSGVVVHGHRLRPCGTWQQVESSQTRD